MIIFINDKNNLFENYIPKCYKVKRILISFNCFSEYIYKHNTSSNGLIRMAKFVRWLHLQIVIELLLDVTSHPDEDQPAPFVDL